MTLCPFLLFLLAPCAAVATEAKAFVQKGAASADFIRSLDEQGAWYARVKDSVYYTLPSNSGDRPRGFYYALGSSDALTDAAKDRLVARDGPVHIFHLPQGTSMLQTFRKTGKAAKNRRNTISDLQLMRRGDDPFPLMTLSNTYVNPLNAAQQQTENSMVKKISENKIMDNLREIVALGDGSTRTRSHENAAATRAAVNHLERKLTSFGYTTCIQTFRKSGQNYTNIIGLKQGSSADTVTLGAHYDSRPFTGLAPGADDNGSGVATALAIAEAFQSEQMSSKKSVYVVFFAGEEAGLIGSNEFVRALTSSQLPSKCTPSSSSSTFLQTEKTPNHKALILDEVGWKSPNMQKTTINLESYDSSVDVLQNLAHASNLHNGDRLKVIHSNNPFGSDHMSFLNQRMQAVLTINGDDEAYPHYHKSTDSIDKVNGAMMEAVGIMNLAALVRLANQ